MPTTTKGAPYPAPGAPNNVPADLYALAQWASDHFGGDALTTAERDALDGADLWDGRLIRNTTTGALELYDLAADAWAELVDTLTPQTLRHKALAAPRETVTIQPGGMGAGTTIDARTTGVLLCLGNATANSTVNVRGSSTVELDDLLAVGDSITVALLVTNGATPYRPTALQVDGAPVTPKWAGGFPPAAGNANGIDAYSYSIIKTAANTFTVLASAGRYA